MVTSLLLVLLYRCGRKRAFGVGIYLAAYCPPPPRPTSSHSTYLAAHYPPRAGCSSGFGVLHFLACSMPRRDGP
jgi:hypothetical protein